MLDCKLDALIRSFAWEKKRFSCQHKSACITWPLTLTLTLSTPWMHADLESIVCTFGGDPAICLRELMVGANSHEFSTLCTLWTNWLQYLAPPLSRAGEVTNLFQHFKVDCLLLVKRVFTDALCLIGGEVVTVVAGTLSRLRTRRYAQMLAGQLLTWSYYTFNTNTEQESFCP